MATKKKRRLPLAATEPPRSPLTPEVLAGIADGEAHVAAAAFAEGPSGVVRAAASASARAASLAKAALDREPPARPIACREGCSFCCHAKVLVVAPEAIRLAEHLRASLPAPALARLVERVREVDAITRGLDRRERTARQIPCPLLDGGACSAYAARPIVCAAWTSLDVGACEASYEDPRAPSAPVFGPGYEVASAVLAGLGKGCFDAGLDGAPLELVAALAVALERPNAAARFLEGRPLFAAARDAEWAAAHDRRGLSEGGR